MTSSQFDPDFTLVQPQKPRTSFLYGSINGPSLKTLLLNATAKKLDKISMLKFCNQHNFIFEFFYSLS